MVERTKAAAELAKIMGLTKERVELSGPNGGAVRYDNGIRFYIPENNRDKEAEEAEQAKQDAQFDALRKKFDEFRKPGDTQTITDGGQ